MAFRYLIGFAHVRFYNGNDKLTNADRNWFINKSVPPNTFIHENNVKNVSYFEKCSQKYVQSAKWHTRKAYAKKCAEKRLRI